MNLSPAGHSLNENLCVNRHRAIALQPAQGHFLNPMAFAFLQDEIGARTGRQDVFVQVDEIDAIPDVGCRVARFTIG
jgi:hypothetical protein